LSRINRWAVRIDQLASCCQEDEFDAEKIHLFKLETTLVLQNMFKYHRRAVSEVRHVSARKRIGGCLGTEVDYVC
jgi:hypothetical protein